MKSMVTLISLFYLKMWAKLALMLHTPTVIGIAGSVGKSSTRDILYAILKEYFPTKMTFGNSETGIPLSILGIKPQGYSWKDWLSIFLLCPFKIFNLKDTEYLVAEMGIDDPRPPKNMEYLLEILRPKIAISLNISATHTMQFENALQHTLLKKSAKEKSRFLLTAIAHEDTKIITTSGCSIGIYNAMDPFIVDQIKAYKKTPHNNVLLTFGTSKNDTISIEKYTISLQGTSFLLRVKKDNSSMLETISIFLKDVILPKEYWELIAAAVLCARYCGLSNKQIIYALEKNLTLPKGRTSVLKGIRNTTIIDSSYNASRSAVLSFLELANTLKRQRKAKLLFLFGDMRELGEEAKKEHEQVTERIVSIVDYLYCVGPLTKAYVLPYLLNKSPNPSIETKWFDNARNAGRYIRDHVEKNTIILVKGSQNTLFLEEAIKEFLNDKKDEEKLCRQEAYWMKIKNAYFSE